MRRGQVFYNTIPAGTLTESPESGYLFEYTDGYLSNPSLPAISPTIPKTQKVFRSRFLFPFFTNMLSEGSNRMVQSKLHHIDSEDDFGLLLATAYFDTPGAVTVKKIGDD